MEIGIIGLGRMGMGMGARLAQRGHKVIGHSRSEKRRPDAQAHGMEWAGSPAELAQALSSPRVVVVMVPAGDPVDSTIAAVKPGLSEGDIVIDGGNSFYKDSIRRSEELAGSGIRFLDMGVSGGVWGLSEGYCVMAGGDEDAFRYVEPLLVDLSAEGGCAHVGASGAGHFAKMVHNGIEYAMMQAYAEGFELLDASRFDFDFRKISALWNNGSVIRSWLLELAESAFADSPDLDDIHDWVEDSGEGRWTVMESIDQAVPAPVIALSLMMRFRSRQQDTFSGRLLAALREKFGGHDVKRK